MSKKDMTTGEEFENFMSFAINYKVKPKKPSIKQVVNRVRKELEEIAKELKISRSYVSRIETKAIGKLAKELKE